MQTNSNLLDLAYLTSFTKDDPIRLRKYLDMYLKSAPVVINEFQQLLAEKDYDTLMLKAHSIKPQAQYLGIEQLKEVLIAIEYIIKDEGDFTKLQNLVDQANQISDEVALEVNAVLDR